MLIELDRSEFQRVLPLYRAWGMRFPLLSAVIQGQQRGQVFVDCAEEPKTAAVITNFGFMGAMGAVENEKFDAGLNKLFSHGNLIKPGYLMWYAPPEAWEKGLLALGTAVKSRRRIRYRFEPGNAGYLMEKICPPAGMELRLVDQNLVSGTQRLGVALASRFWTSAEDFCRHGFGVALMEHGLAVSLCYAACIADNLAEVDVVTLPEYRGKGLARMVSQRFIIECHRRNIDPTWDCFEYNEGSIKLARNLGFAEDWRYAFLSFNIPHRDIAV
jgi:GNAT superfamily N-acetyltransferase